MALYTNNLTQYERWLTREVKIGDIPLGGKNPIRIQSMTTTDTMDTLATVEQTIRMVEAGCEYVRITAPSIKEAENLANIKKELKVRGYSVPLIADIHYTPNAAELAARIVEKVRVNPGNYADKKKFENIEYTDDAYNKELERIRQKFTPLVKICKEYGTAMRIGTNHGSLSDRIMSRYGDSPLGMVESAMEFLRICEDLNYHNIVLSMKASNTQIMVQAYRLLVATMKENNMNYPLHLGVTEAGDGEDGRIKSAVGIGTLLEDGLGDTIRVSLTEDPEFEAPVAKALAERYSGREKHQAFAPIKSYHINPFEYNRRSSSEINNIGGKSVPIVIADLSDLKEIKPANLFAAGYTYSVPTDKWTIGDMACDYIFVGANEVNFEIPGTLGIIQNEKSLQKKDRHYSIAAAGNPDFLKINAKDLAQIPALKNLKNTTLVLETDNLHGLAEQRAFVNELLEQKITLPVILKRSYSSLSPENFQLHSATDFGGLLLDGLGDGIWIKAEKISLAQSNSQAFGILQATRTRISKTEYISCPSCGRTLFDLQETTAKIRAVTHHLKGVKIGIMGCIVNGPGEMADADYGYVGSGVGKITLYKGKEVVKKSISSELAVDALIALIKENGDWVEKK
ncbi:MAG: (E)-4-hydroxy-3-methylbut-2-enyl-diphosphate synthase [Bacteroidetes bacterium]|nr:(E)-4-hydroxy-3-methylbut-2-enyl-diphosphate synthase [Bacteroidota bacterium]